MNENLIERPLGSANASVQHTEDDEIYTTVQHHDDEELPTESSSLVVPLTSVQIAMPSEGKTMEFPRKDNIFKSKESIGYDEIQTQVWRDRPKIRKDEDFKEWLAYILIGLGCGTIAFAMISLEDGIFKYVGLIVRYLTRGSCTPTLYPNPNGATIDGQKMENVYMDCDVNDPSNMATYGPWLFFATICGTLGLIGGIMTTYYGQAAAGSGLAEMVGYLNGVNYPGFIGKNTLITKVIGVELAVCGRLCVGKEGPLAHIGANVGAMIPYVPGFGLEFLRNDEKRRQFVAAGASAGVSVAFGAPIGGALFAYEMSRPNTFWRFSMIWKVFVSCAIANFWVILISQLYYYLQNGTFDLQSQEQQTSALKFGRELQPQEVNTIYIIPASIILGIVGGMAGALFINVNTRMAVVRKRFLTKKWMKPIETFCWCFLTASFFFWCPKLFNTCRTIEYRAIANQQYIGWCGNVEKDGHLVSQYNPLAAHFWSSEGAVIRTIISVTDTVTLWELICFGGVWYGFFIVTYGTNIPAGLFLPGMIIGCVMGDLCFRIIKTLGWYGLTEQNYTDPYHDAIRRKYIIIGCGAFMAGYTRMTYALGVILMETSEDLDIFIPMIFTIVISNQVGYMFTRSLYQRATRTKQLPIISDKVPGPCRALKVGDIMSSNIITLNTVDTMENIKMALESKHHAFPIVDSDNNFIGIIPRNFVIILIQYEAFYAHSGTGRRNTVQSSVVSTQQLTNKILKIKVQDKEKYQKINKKDFSVIKSKVKSNSGSLIEGDLYPMTSEDDVLPWQVFTKNMIGLDLTVDSTIQNTIDEHINEKIDFRPYMNDDPITVNHTDSLNKCTDVFRKMHLRHLCVIHPKEGHLIGMVTRQDIFMWLDL